MARKKGKRKRTRASLVYTFAVAVLIVAALFLALSLHGLFAPPASREAPITVLVLNGCGAEGVGLRTAKLLRSRGLDVIDFRNADNFGYAETIVVDRTGDLSSAVAVAQLLGVVNVIQQVPETPLVDVVVIVGADHEAYVES